MLETPEPHPKQKHRRPESRKHVMFSRFWTSMFLFWTRFWRLKTPLLVFFTLDFFRHYATFLNFFGFHQRVSTPLVSIFCNTMGVKNPKGSPFYIFRHCDTVQKSHFQFFFRKFLKISPGSPFNFFSYFATNWSFTKPKGSPFYNFES